METIKEANKFSFGLGIFLFATFGFTILLTGFEIKSTLGFLLGVYNIWQHGFVNDASKEIIEFNNKKIHGVRKVRSERWSLSIRKVL